MFLRFIGSAPRPVSSLQPVRSVPVARPNPSSVRVQSISSASSVRMFSTSKPSVLTPQVREQLMWAGYKDDQIETMDQKNIDFFLKNRLTDAEITNMKSAGYSDKQIQGMNYSMLKLSWLNETDDGYGMSPMPRAGLIEIVTRRKPDEEQSTTPKLK